MDNAANNSNASSLGSAALVAGLSLLVMVIFAPYAEMYVFPKLIVRCQPTETAKIRNYNNSYKSSILNH